MPLRHEKLVLYKKYTPDEYPKYENYDAINVDKTTDIPMNYNGVIGVPITFLDKYDPDQFEIIGMSKTPIGTHLRTKEFPSQTQVDKNGRKSNVTKLNDGAAIKVKVPPSDKTYYIVDGNYYVAIYPRILIKLKRHQ
jgi:rRNA pseudouridine-1189 N-methylase Emg1 (Nep1/Mra1 family)